MQNPWNRRFFVPYEFEIKKQTVFHVPKIYVCHSIAILDFKLELSSRNAQIGAKAVIQTGVTAQKRSFRVKIVEFFSCIIS